MYGRPQQPQAYPRQYGNAYPSQHQPQYPPQQQSQFPPHQPGAYPPQGQYPPRQGYPSQQQPPGYGGAAPRGGGPSPPRGVYGRSEPQARPTMPMARGSLPYGVHAPVRAAVSSYESQAQKWKKGFAVVPGATGAATSGSSRSSDIEAPLIAELCSSAGSSYPPRDLLQKLLRHLPSLDHEYVCELLDDKLDDRVWQVQGKALSVLDALFKSQQADVYKTHYYYKFHVLETLCHSRKELLRARAEKVFNVVKSFAPPAPPSPEADQPVESSLLPQSTITTNPVPAHEVNLLGSPMLVAQAEPADAPPSSAFGFLNSSIDGGALAEAPVPAPAPVEAQPADQPPVSAFSFLSSQTVAPVQPPITRVVAVSPIAVAPAVDIFASLPLPTPVAGLVAPVEEPVEAHPVEEQEPPIHDPIHDAFEGLGFGEEAEDGTAMDENSDNPLEGFSTASSSTMGFVASVATIDPSDPIREIILEVDVPAGPMGLMLDRSIPHMAVVQGFVRMPTGERGYLDLHPVLCPGCALVSINGMNIEDKELEEVGAILGSLMHSYKVLRFKKLMRSGRTVNPADPDVVYVPPPPEKAEAPPAEDNEETETEGDDGREFMERLTGFSTQLDEVEQQVEALVQRDRSNLPVVDLKNQLAQLHGNVEKIQTEGIDAVILGENPPTNADEIRQLRSSLVRRSDELTKRIQKIVTNGTAPSPLVAPVAVGSPEVSAFSFVGGVNGMPPMPPMPPMPSLQLPEVTAAPVPPPSSGFSFLQSASSPVSSPHSAGPPGSAFSFMTGSTVVASTDQPPPPAPAAVSDNAVFAGLTLRGGTSDVEASSAFGFLSGTAQSESVPAVGVLEPPRVMSPTAFSFLHGSAASPPASPQASGPPGSAFSFIS